MVFFKIPVDKLLNVVPFILPTVVALPVLVTSPVKFALVVTVLAVPDKVPVIIFAEKFPLASLATIALAVFALVAVVAELATLPPVLIVANFESSILPANCAFVIPAVLDKLLVVNPVAEIVPALIEIPEPAVNAVCLLLNVVQSALLNKPAVTLVVDAIGIFKVCVDDAELNAGAVPVVPTVKVCVPEVMPLIAVIPVAAGFVQAILVPLEDNTWPFAPTLVNPVPPLATAIVVPLHVPEVMVPTVVISVPTNLLAAMLPANCALVIPAVLDKLLVVNPVAEMVPPDIDIPDPAVNAVCLLLNLVQSALLNNPAVTLVVDANGIFKVCVDDAELNAGAVPVVPTVKVCVPEVMPLIAVIPVAAGFVQAILVPLEDNT